MQARRAGQFGVFVEFQLLHVCEIFQGRAVIAELVLAKPAMVQPGAPSGFTSMSLPKAEAQSLVAIQIVSDRAEIPQPSSQAGFSFRAFLYRSMAFSS